MPGAAGGPEGPPFIPQTIEYALRCAQAATAAALVAGETRLVVTLPMGRSRRHWYRLSPLDGELVRKESATLALHFAELFKGARIRVVVGVDPEVGWRVPWLERCEVVGGKGGWEEDGEARAGEVDVVVFGGLVASQRAAFNALLGSVAAESAVVLFNCFMEVPVKKLKDLDSFRPAYVCRSAGKVAVLFVGYGDEAEGWHVYTETAIFEFEWVGRRDADWLPTPDAIERVVQARGCRRRSLGGYWESASPGCESGFWPFHSIASREVLPIPGSRFDLKGKSKSSRGNSKPFGFF